MNKIVWWDKALESWLKLKDEVIKVSQLGKTGFSRSFLIHERMKLTAQLGQEAYHWIIKNGSEESGLNKLVGQIQKLDSRIRQMDEKVSGITHHLSRNLNAEEGNDISSKRKLVRRKK